MMHREPEAACLIQQRLYVSEDAAGRSAGARDCAGSSVLDPGHYRQLDQIDNKYRERTRVGEPMRLDQLHRAYYQKALQGDAAAGRLLWCGSARGARDARAR